ncbi:hypothetical protein L596_006595 [Steinernema carpocapsae]|uniref:FHA domain-containing protein n=1 Tax=Steinernema carpocapsae TaxID=34508 RepID=A0A4U8V592_STECR|nr:hypothetical protein L596_006595 [Steinernema carpocapsae]
METTPSASFSIRRNTLSARTVGEFRNCLRLRLDLETKIGRNPEVVDVVLTSHQYSACFSNMISRDHSVIRGLRDQSGKFVRYLITDNSLNGTYINDYRVKDSVELHDNDIIKFGHVNGAAIKAGEHAPQYKAEFAFVFEKCNGTHAYPGFNPDGSRMKHIPNQNQPFLSITSGGAPSQHPFLRDAAAVALAGLAPMTSRTCPAPAAAASQLPSRSAGTTGQVPPVAAATSLGTTNSSTPITVAAAAASSSALAEQLLSGANRSGAFPYFPISNPFPFWPARCCGF